MASSHILNGRISTVSQLLKSGAITSYELTQMCLERVGKTSPLNSYITVTEEEALEQANNSDIRRSNNNVLSGLDGIPISVKDNFNTKGIRTTCASRMLFNYVSPYDATCVSKLITQSGMVLVGKTNMDEFAIGSGNTDSYFGPTINPWRSGLPFSQQEIPSQDPLNDKIVSQQTSPQDTTNQNNEDGDVRTSSYVSPQIESGWFIPGGSSGGSAVSVAAGSVFASLGTDTGGSTRLPASFVGVVGFKPTYGVISRHGVIPLSHSLDTVGILARYTEDVSFMFEHMRGFDPYDSTSIKWNYPDEGFNRDLNLADITVGIPEEYLLPEMDASMIQSLEETIKRLKDLGVTVKRVSLPHTKYARAVYTILNSSELASNFACYDGVRYGHRESIVDKDVSREEFYEENRTTGFGDPVKGRIQAGNFFLLQPNYEKYMNRAYQVRRLIYDDFKSVLNGSPSTYGHDLNNNNNDSNGEPNDDCKVDLLLTPIGLGPAVRYSDFVTKDNREQASRQDYCTQPSNLTGHPAICLPCGISQEGLPLSLQLISAPFTDNFLLSAAHQFENLFQFDRLKYN